jgi:methyl-accepting chemotaxis protein
MFRNLKLGKKIGLGFGLVLVLLTSVALIGLFGINKADKGIEHYRSSVTDTNLMSRLQSSMLMVRLSVLGYLDSPNQADLANYKNQLAILNQYLSDSKTEITQSKKLSIIDEISQSITTYDQAFAQVVNLSAELANTYTQRLVPHGEEMRDSIDKLISYMGYSSNQSDILDAVALQREMLVGRLFVVKYFESNQEADYQVAVEHMDTMLSKNINNLSEKLSSTGGQEVLAIFDKSHKAYVEDMRQIYDLVHQRNTLVSGTLTIIGPKVADLAENVKSMVLVEQETLGPELEQTTHQSMIATSILALAAIVIGIGASLVLSKIITGPIYQAVKAANQLADGDLTIKIPAHAQDETGMLLEAVQNTATKLRLMIGTISQSSIELASASEELAVVTEQTSQGILQQETETDLVATAMNEMASTVHDVANNAAKAADAANQADKEAASGSAVVELTIKAINDLHDNVNNSSTKLDEVEKQVDNISKILSVIRGIADQTNLLALNAAIEAARAGEQGRGFAVVADEVRSLASRTQDSTQEIQNIIGHLQSGTKLTVEAMEEGKLHAVTCVRQAEQTNSALTAITRAIALINEMNFQIASASEQQSSVAETINQNVENVRRIAEENASGASQTMSSSKEIAQLADRLNQLVVQFKI